MSTFINDITAKQLVIRQNATIDVIPSKKTPGRYFFQCGIEKDANGNNVLNEDGSVKRFSGYVSAKTAQYIEANKSNPKVLDELHYAEALTQDGSIIPCLVLPQSSAVASLGADLLH